MPARLAIEEASLITPVTGIATYRDWEPSPYSEDSDPIKVALLRGDKILLENSGESNDGAECTVSGIAIADPNKIEIRELLTVPDEAEYGFRIIRLGAGIPSITPPPPTPNIFEYVTDYDMEFPDTTYWLPSPGAGSNIVVSKQPSFLDPGEGGALCLRIQNLGLSTNNYAYQVIDAGGSPGDIGYDIYCRSVDGVAYPRLYIGGWLVNGTTSTSAQSYSNPSVSIWVGPPVDLRLYCEGTGMVEFDLVRIFPGAPGPV